MKKVAIIGAGFTGLAVAWYLVTSSTKVEITVIDAKGIGQGSSGISAGLVHPYAGLHAKLNRYGYEGWNATCELIEIAEKALDRSIANFSGIIRPALTPEQESDYKLSAQKYPQDVTWLSTKELQELAPQAAPSPGIFIRPAALVNSSLYLSGLWQACQTRGINFVLQKINSLEDLNTYDIIIAAPGPGTVLIPELAPMPISLVKGQIIKLAWPKELPPLQIPLNSQIYIAMEPDQTSCIVGATYERESLTEGIDLESVKKELFPKVTALIPQLDLPVLLDCQAGLRVSTPDHLPLLRRINKKCWMLTGMGSKGLLYHAYFAKKLCAEITI